MRHLYARFILFLIRPALEINQKNYEVKAVVNTKNTPSTCGKCQCSKAKGGRWCFKTGSFVQDAEMKKFALKEQ